MHDSGNIDIAALLTRSSYMGFGLFAVVCVLCYRMMIKKNYLILLVWPIAIYFCGPTLTGMFGDAPVLGRYVFPEDTLAETTMMFLYFVSLIVADRVFGISEIIDSSLSHPLTQRLAHSLAFLPIFIVASLTAMVLQVKLLVQFGTVLTGAYVMLGVDEGLIPFWGFLAGLYELIFLLFILFILSKKHSLGMRICVIGTYCVTAALRVAGGTRLILVKELAFVVILFFLRGKLKTKQLALVVAAIVVLGSGVGLLRQKDMSDNAIFGPIFGLVMESALDSLTLNIAYHVQESGYTAQHADIARTGEFLVLSAVPSFLRFGISQAEISTMNPYNSALNFGFDTYNPVGGMSGFATLCYICSYPATASILLGLSIGMLFRFAPSGNVKRITVLVFLLNAIHFWRDPLEIAIKQVVQDDLCALTLLAMCSLQFDRRKLLSTPRRDQPAVDTPPPGG